MTPAHTSQRTPPVKKNLAVIGGQWGDEGKAKVVDLCAEDRDIVARFSGGRNAGHTVKIGNRKFAFHLLPSGFASGKVCVLAGGVLLMLEALVDELRENTPNLPPGVYPTVLIDERCPLWTPYHKLLEAHIEKARGDRGIGTTGNAIGPMVGAYTMRIGLIAAHLRDPEKLLQAVEELHRILQGLIPQAETLPSPTEVTERLVALAREAGIVDRIVNTGAYLFQAIQEGKWVVFEGAQATGLSIEAGTWPFVTSTSAIAGGVATGTLLPPRAVCGTLLVFKLFPTRVGEGPMPSELSTRAGIREFYEAHRNLLVEGAEREAFLTDRLKHLCSGNATAAELGEYVMVKARELGVTTKRPRSPGRPDLAWARYAIRINDPFACALNCLDIASGLPELEVVTAYSYQGKQLPPMEVPVLDLYNVTPVIERWPGWEQDITGLTVEDQLSTETRTFIDRYENAIERRIQLIGTGPRREDVIIRPLTDRFRTFFY